MKKKSEIKIRKATRKDIIESLKIANDLKEWFDNNAREKNMPLDFKLNNLIVAVEGKSVIGFLCYTSYSGKMLLVWMGVKRDYQRKGIGKILLDWLIKEAKRLKLHSIEVETLTDEDDYEPYTRTRKFYYECGFKRIGYKKAKIKGWDDQIVLEKRLK